MKIVDKYEDREYTAIATNNGIVLCDKVEGAFIVLRSSVDLSRLKDLLNKLEAIERI